MYRFYKVTEVKLMNMHIVLNKIKRDSAVNKNNIKMLAVIYSQAGTWCNKWI